MSLVVLTEGAQFHVLTRLEFGEFFGTLFRRRNTQRFLLVVIKVARITCTVAFRGEWRFQLNV